MMKQAIPRKTVYRLSLYYRSLQRLQANEVDTVSSAALAKASGVKPTQLRKDLTYFGQFGTRGLGYDVKALSAKLTDVLGTTHLQPVILVGAGVLAILNFAPIVLQVPDNVVVNNVDLAIELENLSYFIQ